MSEDEKRKSVTKHIMEIIVSQLPDDRMRVLWFGRSGDNITSLVDATDLENSYTVFHDNGDIDQLYNVFCEWCATLPNDKFPAIAPF